MNKLREYREAKGLNQQQLADLVSTSQPQIARLEKEGKEGRKLTKEWAERIAPHLGVTAEELMFATPSIRHTVGLPVKGKVQAGKWLDVSLVQDLGGSDPKFVHVAADPRFPNMIQYALLVVGDSMNKKYEDGSYVTCVAWGDTGLRLKHGMCLHVERNEGALTENTLKCYTERAGKRWLEPMSTNPKHEPIEITGEEDRMEMIVRGLVTGFWKPEVYI